MTMNRILLVCIGNICRSPLAEALLKQHFPDKTVHSAGLAALVGHPADSTAQDIAHQHGLDLSAHRAQQITQAMRSEEHTSELQSLMRIAYAVFCMQKKKRSSK